MPDEIYRLIRLAYVNGTHGITILSKNSQNLFAREAVLLGFHQKVSQILFHPAGDVLVACGNDGIRVWDLKSGEVIKMIKYVVDGIYVTF